MTKAFQDSSYETKLHEYEALKQRYRDYQKMGLALDMTRGKPSPEQLDRVVELGFEHVFDDGGYLDQDGTDCRNYGQMFGLKSARRLFAEILNHDPENVIVLNNSSLSIMYDILMRALLFPLPGADQSWRELPRYKVLCPAPGYDRHFQLAESLGAELIYVPMLDDGPDMDMVEELVLDPLVKAMFFVPIYSNPTGIVFSDHVIERMASMKAAADFRIFYDNAYCVHNLYPDQTAHLVNILELAARYGHPDRFFEVASSSKMTFAGAGISAMATSKANLDWFAAGLKYRSIGPNKINQIQHVRFFEHVGGYRKLMEEHAALLRPKFELVEQKLRENFSNTDLAHWHTPKGGYFFSVDLRQGQASRVHAAAKAAGVTLTAAGATFPYGKDPMDRNIRLAPSYPSLDQLEAAMDIFCLCIRLCAIQSELGREEESLLNI